MRIHTISLILLTLLASAACDRGDGAGPGGPDPSSSGPAQARRPTTRPGTASVRGRVNLVGWTAPKPPPKMVNCTKHPHAVEDETVIVAADGSLKNVVVHVKDAPDVTLPTPPPVVLDQVNCVYAPHVIAVRAGQTVRFRSSDDVLHNVHIRASKNKDLNLDFKGRGERDHAFPRPEFLNARCDVHPWMSSHIAVLDHPFFAVTDAAGRFDIGRLPAGSYTLVAWHERLGEVEQTFTVADGGTSDVNLTFRPPAE